MAHTVTVLIDLPPAQRFHVATVAALRHAGDHLGVELTVDVVTTDRIGAQGTLG